MSPMDEVNTTGHEPEPNPPDAPDWLDDYERDIDMYWEWQDSPSPRSCHRCREIHVQVEGSPRGPVVADATDLPVWIGDEVVLEQDRRLVKAKVVSRPVTRMRKASRPCPVVRFPTPADERRIALRNSREEEAFRFCRERIRARNLPMKLVGVKYQQSGNKAVFYFGAEGRVDFRALVRDLAQRFHTRIEMRQVGVRDEARMLGGVGVCGQPLCCGSFLGGFASVSIRMAKTQNLALNPQKVSGVCGRLLCCLNYEQFAYEERRKGLPKNGATIQTPRGQGKVKEVDVLRRRIRVQLENGKVVSFNVPEPKEDPTAAPLQLEEVVEGVPLVDPPNRNEPRQEKQQPRRRRKSRRSKGSKQAQTAEPKQAEAQQRKPGKAKQRQPRQAMADQRQDKRQAKADQRQDKRQAKADQRQDKGTKPGPRRAKADQKAGEQRTRTPKPKEQAQKGAGEQRTKTPKPKEQPKRGEQAGGDRQRKSRRRRPRGARQAQMPQQQAEGQPRKRRSRRSRGRPGSNPARPSENKDA